MKMTNKYESLKFKFMKYVKIEGFKGFNSEEPNK